MAKSEKCTACNKWVEVTVGLSVGDIEPKSKLCLKCFDKAMRKVGEHARGIAGSIAKMTRKPNA